MSHQHSAQLFFFLGPVTYSQRLPHFTYLQPCFKGSTSSPSLLALVTFCSFGSSMLMGVRQHVITDLIYKL
jgi:hypothetical protein